MIKKSIDLLDHSKMENLNVSLTESFLRKKEVSDFSLDFRSKPEMNSDAYLEKDLELESEKRLKTQHQLSAALKEITDLQKDLKEAQNKQHHESQPNFENEKLKRQISDLNEEMEIEKREKRLNQDKLRLLEIELQEEREIIQKERSDNLARESKLQKSQLEIVEQMNQRNKQMAYIESKLKKQEKISQDTEDIIQNLREELRIAKEARKQTNDGQSQRNLEKSEREQEKEREKSERLKIEKDLEASKAENSKYLTDLNHYACDNRRMRGELEEKRIEIKKLSAETRRLASQCKEYLNKTRTLEHQLDQMKKCELQNKYYVCNSCKLELESFKKARNQESQNFENIHKNENYRISDSQKNVHLKTGNNHQGNHQHVEIHRKYPETDIQEKQFQNLAPHPNSTQTPANVQPNSQKTRPQQSATQVPGSQHHSPIKSKTINTLTQPNMTPTRNPRLHQRDSEYRTYSSSSKPKLTRVFVNNRLVYDKKSNFENRGMSQDLSLFEDEKVPKRRVHLESLPTGKISLQNIMRASRDREIRRKNRFNTSNQSVVSNNVKKRDLSYEQGPSYRPHSQSRTISLQPKTRVAREGETRQEHSNTRIQIQGNVIRNPGPYHVQGHSGTNNRGPDSQRPNTTRKIQRVQKSHSSEPLNVYRRIVKRTNITPASQVNRTPQKTYPNSREITDPNERASDYYYVRSNSEVQDARANNPQPEKVTKIGDILQVIKYNIENNNIPHQSSTDEKYVVSNLQSFTNQNGTSVEEFSKSMNPDPSSIHIFNLQTSDPAFRKNRINTEITIPNQESPYHVQGMGSQTQQKAHQTLYDKDRGSNYQGNTLYSINSGCSKGFPDPYYSGFPGETSAADLDPKIKKISLTNLKSSGSVQRITQRKPLKGFKKAESGFLDQSLSHNQNIDTDFENFTNQLKNNNIKKSGAKLSQDQQNEVPSHTRFDNPEVYNILESQKFY